MGTKAQPGQYDCYGALADDEPYFLIAARDRHAILLVRLWAMMRELEGEPADVVAEARGVATAMASWQAEHNRGSVESRIMGQILADVRARLYPQGKLL